MQFFFTFLKYDKIYPILKRLYLKFRINGGKMSELINNSIERKAKLKKLTETLFSMLGRWLKTMRDVDTSLEWFPRKI